MYQAVLAATIVCCAMIGTFCLGAWFASNQKAPEPARDIDDIIRTAQEAMDQVASKYRS